MDFEYSSSDELFKLIGQINSKYYERLNANILFLEQLTNSICTAHIIELRDAYSHLVKVFDYDILSPEGKKNVQYHLSAYTGHLQRDLLDTFRKIVDLEFKFIKEYIPKKDVKAVESQIAYKAHEVRIMSEDISFDQKIDGFISLLSYISEIHKKYSDKNKAS